MRDMRSDLRQLALAGVWAGAVLGPAACTCSPSDAPAPTPSATANGRLRDVRRACEHRAAWTHRHRRTCTKCVAAAVAKLCDCRADVESYSAVCSNEWQAKLAAKTCEPVFACARKCKATDCDCTASCYQDQPACRDVASSLEGCIAEVCDPHCD